MLQIPYFSQLDETIKKIKKQQACGICCVKMVLDYYLPSQKNNINDLIQEGMVIKAYNPDLLGGVWVHEGLVRILRNHGIAAYSQEFKSMKVELGGAEEEGNIARPNNEIETSLVNFGMEKIKKCLENNEPVIVSVLPNFAKNQDSHLVIIKGFENNQLIFTDPFSGDDLFFTEEHFLNFWKKLAIFTTSL